MRVVAYGGTTVYTDCTPIRLEDYNQLSPCYVVLSIHVQITMKCNGEV